MRESSRATSVFVSSHDRLILLSIRSGNVIWQKKLPVQMTAAPISYNGNIFIPCKNAYCYKVNVSNGEMQGAYSTNTKVIASPTIKDGLLYLVTKNRVFIFDLRSEKLRYHARTQQSFQSSVIVKNSYWGILGKSEQGYTLFFYKTESIGNIYNLHPSETLAIRDARTFVSMKLCEKILHLFFDNALYTLPITFEIPKENMLTRFLKPESDHLLSLSDTKLLGFHQVPYLFVFSKRSLKSMRKNIRKAHFLGKQTGVFQRSGKIFFFMTQKGKDFWVNAIFLGRTRNILLWQRRLAISIPTPPVIVRNKIVWMCTSSGAIMKMIYGRGLLPRYRMGRGHPYKNITTHLLFLKKGRGQIVLIRSSGRSKLINYRGRTIRDWRMRDQFSEELGKGLSHYKRRILFLTHKNALKAYSLVSGRHISKDFSTSSSWSTSPTYLRGSLFLANAKGQFFRLKLSKSRGRIVFRSKWMYQTNSPIRGNASVSLRGIYFGNENGYFYKLHAGRGKLIWRKNVGAPILSTPLAIDNRIYFGNDAGSFFCFHSRRSEIRWKRNLEGKIRKAPVLMNNRLYIITEKPKIYAFSKAGEKLWEMDLEGDISTFFAYRKRLYLSGINDFLYVVEDK